MTVLSDHLFPLRLLPAESGGLICERCCCDSGAVGVITELFADNDRQSRTCQREIGLYATTLYTQASYESS
jgi:hypothetical protein